jgi:pimeloyl-ACP methyl ester carboxylesterase
MYFLNKLAMLLVTVTLAFAGSMPAHATQNIKCSSIDFPVQLPTGQPANIHGNYCLPKHHLPNTIQILVHGATYNSDYWNWDQFNGQYSYVDNAVAAGYATLAIDRLGDGMSTRPASALDTYAAQVETLHQVITAVHNGALGDRKFRKFELIGHSYGSLYVEGDLAKYQHDADAVILTGSGHTTTSVINAISKADTYSANNLSRFKKLDDGYLTSTPGFASRAALVYDPIKADPRVIQHDADTMDTLDITEAQTRPVNQGLLSIQIHVRTLLIDGNTDNHSCGPDVDDCSSQAAFYASEAPYFSPAAHLTAMLVNSGHDIQLSYVSHSADNEMLEWSLRTLG